MARFDPDTERRLRRAGWRPGRDVWGRLTLPRGIEAFDAVRKVLSEFGGLTFRIKSGSTTLDPAVDDKIEGEIRQYAAVLGRPLYPLGITDGGDTIFILIDPEGVVYALGGTLEPLASTFDQAIKYLSRVFTVNQSEQRRDLAAIGLLGKSWTR